MWGYIIVKIKKLSIVLTVVIWFVSLSLGFSEEIPEKNAIIEMGSTVSIEYTLTLENEEVADTNVGGDPLVYRQGANQIVPGLESALVGMKVGDKKRVKVLPANGYGPVNPQAIIEVEVDKLPEEIRKIGARVQSQVPGGRSVQGVVKEVNNNIAIVDFNHPLAGKILFFDVKILKIEQ
jgi:FKBP-type peptidyl-prolyl cis-trans isomerase SlyD